MYIGNDLQIAHPSYKIIDDISSGFNGSTTSFALQVNGATPVPFPISTQQVMISVNGVVQEPDPSGSAGFKLLGSNIVFSSAPANGHAFFGVINAGADYVTAGSEFPDGSVTAPSFTFQDDQDTGWFRSGSGAVGYSANGVQTLTFDGNGLTVTGDASFVGDSAKNLLWDKSDGALEFADNAKATFGTGADLTIKHESNTTYATNITGSFYIQSNNLALRSASQENYLIAAENGAVELYHDNVKTLATDPNGIFVYGPEGGSALIRLYADEGDDNADKWRILNDHSSSNNLTIQNYSTGSWVSGLTLDSSNNATFAGQIEVSGNIIANNEIGLFNGSTNASRYIDAGLGDNNTLFIRGCSGGDTNHETLAQFTRNGACTLFHDASARIATTAAGVTVTGSVTDSKGNLRSIPQNNQGGAYTLVAADAGKHVLAGGNVTIPNSIWTAGDAVTIINTTSGDITLTANIGALINSADAATGNRTLATKGMATILFVSATGAYISGAGLS